MSTWIGAHQLASDAANAVRRSTPGQEVRQGDFLAPEPLEQFVTTLTRSADALADYPDTAEFVSQLREIAYRWNRNGRPKTGDEWKRDYDIVVGIEREMFNRMMAEQRGEAMPPKPTG